MFPIIDNSEGVLAEKGRAVRSHVVPTPVFFITLSAILLCVGIPLGIIALNVIGGVLGAFSIVAWLFGMLETEGEVSNGHRLFYNVNWFAWHYKELEWGYFIEPKYFEVPGYKDAVMSAAKGRSLDGKELEALNKAAKVYADTYGLTKQSQVMATAQSLMDMSGKK